MPGHRTRPAIQDQTLVLMPDWSMIGSDERTRPQIASVLRKVDADRGLSIEPCQPTLSESSSCCVVEPYSETTEAESVELSAAGCATGMRSYRLRAANSHLLDCISPRAQSSIDVIPDRLTNTCNARSVLVRRFRHLHWAHETPSRPGMTPNGSHMAAKRASKR